jgi:glycerophosphoryl diester phosphodiesterase
MLRISMVREAAMRRRWKIASGVAAVMVAVGLYNSSLFAPSPHGVPGVLAHRGIHQEFSREGLDIYNGCTANRIYPPTNPYLENTLPSMRAGFAAGATREELDVHPTTDGEFAVFHDWKLECRTNGHGVTRDQTMAYLKTLDLGYGYTADGGKTFPFRGKGVGMMPTLHEVLALFPDKSFLINVKSNDAKEADALIAYLRKYGHPTDGRLRIFADGDRPAERFAQLAPDARIQSKARAKSCTLGYLLLGWTGHVPAICRSTGMGVPTNLRWLYWGWPNRFLERMRQADVEVFIVGPLGSKDGVGVAHPEQLDAIPEGFSGTIITDDIQHIGPEVRRRWPLH